ncbi:MAG TPA: aspartyl protease family protein [Steroidobacteraceae bacterium]|nr:aspartyl protease family protein [Steroidobacteraceae bacterium]
MSAVAGGIGARAPGATPPGASSQAPEIVVEAPEPRFVAPTRRDKIGRIWAPVMINGRGPFRLVLDTGASRSAVNAQVAEAIGIAPDPTRPVLLRGVTGIVAVPTIRVDSFRVGDVIVTPAVLPIVADALGGADGVLGTEGFTDKRVYIDFRHDLITITHSRATRAPPGFISLPLERSGAGLLIVSAHVGGVRVHAIIDTGGQSTIGNEALRQSLVRRRAKGARSEVIDVTNATQVGESFPSPPIELGPLEIQGARITYGDMHIFEHWHLNNKPALLVGMDAIGLLDVFIIDYRRHELQLRTRVDRQ